jgi:trans-aconitate 2-methyltransferase
MNQDPWNPRQYERFRNERSQPFFDLMALVQPQLDMRVIDLGCGTGDLTRLLHEHLKARETVGVDRSEAMLAESRAFAGGGLRFEAGDINDFAPSESYDLIFSNAALHWAADHEKLLARLTAALTERGQLAVQVPANFDHPSHTVAADIASEQPFRDALGGFVRLSPVLKPEEYAALLYGLGYREQHVRLQVYGHQLSGREDVIEWVKGTLLTDYERRMPADLYVRFLEQYRERLLPLLDPTRPYFYPFKRILFWARRR